MRRLAAALGIALLLLAAAAGLAVVWRIELASAVVRYGLERSGFPDAAFAVEVVTFDRLVLAAIEAGGVLRAERLELDLDLGRLPGLPVERMRLVAPTIDLGELPEREESPTDERGGGARGRASVPLGLLPVLQIERGVLRTPSPVGELVLRLDSTVEPRPGFVEMTLRGDLSGDAASALLRVSARLDQAGPVSMSMDLDAVTVRSPALSVDRGATTLRLTGRADGLDLRHAEGVLEASLGGVVAGETSIGEIATTVSFSLAERDERWVATLSQTAIRLPGFDLDASGIAGEVALDGLDLQVARLVDRRRERRFEPLALRLRVPKTEPEIPFSLEIAAAGGRATVRAFGRYQPATETLLAEVVWRLELSESGLRPRDLSPRLAFDGTLDGVLAGRALVTWSARGGLTGRASVEVEDATIATDAIRATGVSGKIALDGFDPPSTDGVQEIRATEVHPGVSLADAALRFALEPAPSGGGSRLAVERFHCGFAGGRILVEGATIDPVAERNAVDFRFDEVDVAELFAIAAVDGVSGTGTLSGVIPVAVRGADVAIDGGRLSSSAGVLRVRSDSFSRLLSAGGEPTELLLDALREFHYDSLVVEIEKEFAGETEIVLRLEGLNPAVLRGHPFRLNLNLSGNLDRLVRSLLEVARLSDRAVRTTVEAAR